VTRSSEAPRLVLHKVTQEMETVKKCQHKAVQELITPAERKDLLDLAQWCADIMFPDHEVLSL